MCRALNISEIAEAHLCRRWYMGGSCCLSWLGWGEIDGFAALQAVVSSMVMIMLHVGHVGICWYMLVVVQHEAQLSINKMLSQKDQHSSWFTHFAWWLDLLNHHSGSLDRMIVIGVEPHGIGGTHCGHLGKTRLEDSNRCFTKTSMFWSNQPINLT